MSEAITIGSVAQIHGMLGKAAPVHPLITVLDNHRDRPAEPLTLDLRIISQLYAVSLKNGSECAISYGRRSYDFQAGSLVFLAPGQLFTPVAEPLEPRADEPSWTLVFHPDLIRGSSLATRIHSYRFFGYEAREALHVCEQERRIVCELADNIEAECRRAADEHARELIVGNLGLLLGYCQRFYTRQFDTRVAAHRDIVTRFDALLRDYLDSEQLTREGMPSVGYCAAQLGLSANYLSDLLRKETGRSARQHIHAGVLERAKDLLLGSEQTVAEIAYALGFAYPQHFSKLFKSKVGVAPTEFRG